MSGQLRNRGGGRLFCPAARFAVCGAQNRPARLPHRNAAYIKEQLFSRFRSSNRFSKNRSKANRSKGLPLEGLVPFFLIAKRPMPPRSHR
jgi:hypothetical protein